MLQDKLKALAELNRALEESKAWEDVKQEKLKMLPEYHEIEKIQAEQAQIKEQIDQAQGEIKTMALQAYIETGDKKPADGVGIRVYKKLDYDILQAVEWCKVNLEQALNLNVRTFEKYAKGVEEVKPLEFVRYYEEPGATISSDLSDYLE